MMQDTSPPLDKSVSQSKEGPFICSCRGAVYSFVATAIRYTKSEVDQFPFSQSPTVPAWPEATSESATSGCPAASLGTHKTKRDPAQGTLSYERRGSEIRRILQAWLPGGVAVAISRRFSHRNVFQCVPRGSGLGPASNNSGYPIGLRARVACRGCGVGKLTRSGWGCALPHEMGVSAGAPSGRTRRSALPRRGCWTLGMGLLGCTPSGDRLEPYRTGVAGL